MQAAVDESYEPPLHTYLTPQPQTACPEAPDTYLASSLFLRSGVNERLPLYPTVETVRAFRLHADACRYSLIEQNPAEWAWPETPSPVLFPIVATG